MTEPREPQFRPAAVPPPLPPQAPAPLPVPPWVAAPPRPPRIWPTFVLFLIIAVAMLSFSGLPLLIWVAVVDGPAILASPELFGRIFALMMTPAGLASVALMNVLILSSAALLAARLSPVPLRQRLAWVRPAGSTMLIPAMALVGMAVSWWLGILVMWLELIDPEGGGAIAMMNQVFRSTDGLMLAMMILVVGLLVPLAEELVFRGYIQSRLQLRLGAAAGVLIASALFGLLHMDPLHSPLAMVMGIYLGYIMVRTGSVWPPMIAHAAINISAVLSARLLPPKFGEAAQLLGLLGLPALVLIGLVVIHAGTRVNAPTASVPPRL